MASQATLPRTFGQTYFKKNKTLTTIIKLFNIITKEYPIKILNKEFKP